jgi:hypothetical protein
MLELKFLHYLNPLKYSFLKKTMAEWKTIERPGYFGKSRDKIIKLFDERFGKGNHRLMYQWGDLVIPRETAISIYEDAYYEFLKMDSDKLNWLIDNYKDVYDTSISNIKSGFDYNIQETPNNHIHDIAIRRAVLRLGRWFKGTKLLEVRSNNSEGTIFAPHKIPFHLLDLILPLQSDEGELGKIKDYSGKGYWWLEKSIENSDEAFYQQNKILQVRTTA